MSLIQKDLPPQKEYKLFKTLKEKRLIKYIHPSQMSITDEGYNMAKEIAKELGLGKIVLLFFLFLVTWYHYLSDEDSAIYSNREKHLLWRDTDKLMTAIKKIME